MTLISNSSLMFITKPEYQYDCSLTILTYNYLIQIQKHSSTRTLWQIVNPHLLVFILTIYYHISLHNLSTIHSFTIHQCLISSITLWILWALPQNHKPSLDLSPHVYSCSSIQHLHLVITYTMTFHHKFLSSYNTLYFLWWSIHNSSLLSLPIRENSSLLTY